MCEDKAPKQKCLYFWALFFIILAFGFYLAGDNIQPLVCTFYCEDSDQKYKTTQAAIRSAFSGVALILLSFPVIGFSTCAQIVYMYIV